MIITGTILATAIATGFAQGALDSMKDEAKALVSTIANKFQGEHEVTRALAMTTEDPADEDAREYQREYLAKKLEKYEVMQDRDVAQAAERLMETMNQTAVGQGAVAAGSVTQSVSGSGSAYAGGVHITNNQVPAAPAVRWHMTHYSGDTYAVENDGTGSAYDVEVSAEHVVGFDPLESDDPHMAAVRAPRHLRGHGVDAWNANGGHQLPDCP